MLVIVLWLSILRLFVLGSVNLYTVFGPPVSSGSAEFLRILYYYMARSLRDVVTPLGSRGLIETKACSVPYSF